VALVTRRGHVIPMAYDAVNRLTSGSYRPRLLRQHHVLPGGFNPCPGRSPCTTSARRGHDRTRRHGDLRVRLSGEHASSEQPVARISRRYNRNGTLATDTLRIAAYGSSLHRDTTTHVYGLSYGYDLNARRIWLKYRVRSRRSTPASCATRRRTRMTLQASSQPFATSRGTRFSMHTTWMVGWTASPCPVKSSGSITMILTDACPAAWRCAKTAPAPCRRIFYELGQASVRIIVMLPEDLTGHGEAVQPTIQVVCMLKRVPLDVAKGCELACNVIRVRRRVAHDAGVDRRDRTRVFEPNATGIRS